MHLVFRAWKEVLASTRNLRHFFFILDTFLSGYFWFLKDFVSSAWAFEQFLKSLDEFLSKIVLFFSVDASTDCRMRCFFLFFFQSNLISTTFVMNGVFKETKMEYPKDALQLIVMNIKPSNAIRCVETVTHNKCIARSKNQDKKSLFLRQSEIVGFFFRIECGCIWSWMCACITRIRRNCMDFKFNVEGQAKHAHR